MQSSFLIFILLVCFCVSKNVCERAHKPSSVLDDHLSRPGVTAQAQAIAGRDGQPHASHCILHQVGFTSRTSRQAVGELLPRLSTLTSGPKARGGISLLHSPWSRLHRPLTGTLPCGARTFLTPLGGPRSSSCLLCASNRIAPRQKNVNGFSSDKKGFNILCVVYMQ